VIDKALIGFAVAVFGGLIAWSSRRAVRPDVDPQRCPGIRTPTTMASREAWLTGHRAIAPAMFWLGAATTLAGNGLTVWAVLEDPPRKQVEMVSIFIFLVATVGLAVLAVIAHRAIRAAEEKETQTD